MCTEEGCKRNWCTWCDVCDKDVCGQHVYYVLPERGESDNDDNYYYSFETALCPTCYSDHKKKIMDPNLIVTIDCCKCGIPLEPMTYYESHQKEHTCKSCFVSNKAQCEQCNVEMEVSKVYAALCLACRKQNLARQIAKSLFQSANF